jgi:hypothetical protein
VHGLGRPLAHPLAALNLAGLGGLVGGIRHSSRVFIPGFDPHPLPFLFGIKGNLDHDKGGCTIRNQEPDIGLGLMLFPTRCRHSGGDGDGARSEGGGRGLGADGGGVHGPGRCQGDVSCPPLPEPAAGRLSCLSPHAAQKWLVALEQDHFCLTRSFFPRCNSIRRQPLEHKMMGSYH